jgi:ParB/RepB/Spo0J family partition protein
MEKVKGNVHQRGSGALGQAGWQAQEVGQEGRDGGMSMSRDIKEVPISQINVGKYQDRWDGMLPGIGDLADSIKREGLHQPVGVLKTATGYDLVYGHRRLAACKQLGLTTIRAVIYTDKNKAALATLTENAQRADLNQVEEAYSFRRMIDAGFTQQEIAKAIGKTQSYVAQKLRLEKLPRGVAVLLAGHVTTFPLTEGHARQLLRLEAIVKAWEKTLTPRERALQEMLLEGHRAGSTRRDGTADLVSYYQDRFAWHREPDETVNDLRIRISLFAVKHGVMPRKEFLRSIPQEERRWYVDEYRWDLYPGDELPEDHEAAEEMIENELDDLELEDEVEVTD